MKHNNELSTWSAVTLLPPVVPRAVLADVLGRTATAEPAQVPHQPATAEVELDRVLRDGLVRSVYQPIVELHTGITVGYEALARGPGDGPLARPDLLFEAARLSGRLPELEAACQEAALRGARTGGLLAPWTVFVNTEPATARFAFADDQDLWRGEPTPTTEPAEPFRVMVELTERALIDDPTELLLLVARIRSRGWGVALDDLGADSDSLALLPVLRPDVIKLDLRVIQGRPTGEIAQIVSAVNAEAERSGTTVLAEGIETQEHLNIALSMGASLGQGWLLGRPNPLPSQTQEFTGTPIPIVARRHPAFDDSPFAQSTAIRPTRRSRKQLLIEISKHLERQAINIGESAVVVSTFQDVSFFTPATCLRYTELVAHTAFVGALGEGMPPEPLPGVRGCLLQATDPLIAEWVIVVLGPHFAGTLAARDLGDSGPDRDRRFDFVLSHDRELAINVALNLMSRVWAR
jgi:EAL domain-containing protein (putative c-di-GMP-specific phosphodiesterase class I)